MTSSSVAFCAVLVHIARGYFRATYLGPLESEESSQEVLGGLCHAILCCTPGNDLTAIVWVEMSILIVVQYTRVKELLMSHWYENLGSELVTPVVQERQLSSVFGSTCHVFVLLPELVCTTSSGRVAGTVTRKHVHPGDIRARRKRVLVHTKTNGIWKVVAELTMQLVDVAVVHIAGNGHLSLKGRVGNI